MIAMRSYPRSMVTRPSTGHDETVSVRSSLRYDDARGPACRPRLGAARSVVNGTGPGRRSGLDTSRVPAVTVDQSLAPCPTTLVRWWLAELPVLLLFSLIDQAGITLFLPGTTLIVVLAAALYPPAMISIACSVICLRRLLNSF